MSFSAFAHGRPAPDPDQLRAALGPLEPLWRQATARLADDCGAREAAWFSYGRISGWSLNVKDASGTLAYLYPQQDGFIAVVTVGRDEARIALDQGCPPAVRNALDSSRPYPKGHSVLVDVCGPAELDLVIALCRLKRHGAPRSVA